MAYSGPVIDVRYEPDARDDMDSYGEICYEVGLDLEPNKYAKLRKAAMLAQEEQNDPLPCALLCLDEMFLRFRGMFKPQKKDQMLDGRPPRRRIRQARDMEIIAGGGSTLIPSISKSLSYEQDPYSIASAPNNHSPHPNGAARTTTIAPSSSPPNQPCSNLPIRRFGMFTYPGKNPLNFGDYEIISEDIPYDNRRRNIMRNTVFMVNMCFSGEYFEGDLKQVLNQGIDELMIVKKWKKGATTEMKFKKMIEYIALSHFPHFHKEQLKLSDEEFKGPYGRQRIALNPQIGVERLFEWLVDFAFRLGNVPLLDPPSHDFQEIPFYEWAGAPVYPEFEFQLLTTKKKTKTRLVLELSPYTVQELRRLEMDEWCFLYND